jgi:hypothetical protein
MRYHELQEHLHGLGVATNDDGLLTAVPCELAAFQWDHPDAYYDSASTGESIAEQREVVEQVSLGTEDRSHHDEAVPHRENETSHYETTLNHEDGEDQQRERGEEIKADEQEVVEEIFGHDGVQDSAEAGNNEIASHQEEHPEAHDNADRNAEQPAVHVAAQSGEAQVDGQAGRAEEHTHTEETEAPHPEQLHDTEEAGPEQPFTDAGSLQGPEEASEALILVADDEGTGDHDEHAQDAEEREEARGEDGPVEEADHDHFTEGAESHEYQGEEQEHGESEHAEEGEYDVDYDPDQADAEELQEDLEEGDSSEHSGNVNYEEDTQQTDVADNEDGEHQGYTDERSPSPGAEDELPPIDTSLLEAVDADGKFCRPGTSCKG